MIASAVMTVSAYADFKFIVPQAPGGGTSVWTSIVAKELEKHLGEKIILVHIPGVSDIPGFNKFHNELRKDPKTVMVAHGGNGESFLTDKVDYNYGKYDPIALMNLNIAVSHRTDFNPTKDKVKFGALSGRRPDVMAIGMMVCGPKPTVDAYIKCFKEKVIYVKGMKPSEARLSALRGELNTLRETFASHRKFIEPQIKAGKYKIWFSHGVLDLKTGKMIADKNFPVGSFADMYKARWGVEPSGDFYNAYVLVKSFRDVLQKSLWVDRGNPNAEKLRNAVRAMLKDPKSKAALDKNTGDYEWFIGKDMTQAYKIIRGKITAKSLRDLVKFTNVAMGVKGYYKPELLK